MKSKRKISSTAYNVINVVILLAAAGLFVLNYRFTDIFGGTSYAQVGIVLASAIIVHLVKASRLYLALYSQDINGASYVKTYCKVTPVSVIFPFKLGELFRMYCYGKLTGSFLRSIVIVLLDRVMDTIALIAVIVVSIVLSGGQITFFMYLLILFIAVMVLLYLVFPGLYRYWKKYLLKARATERKLHSLKALEYCNRVYAEIAKVIKGRGIILFFLSLIAWGTEIGGVAIINRLRKNEPISDKIMLYLTSALKGQQGIEMKQFIFISVVLMITMYILVKAFELLGRKRADR